MLNEKQLAANERDELFGFQVGATGFELAVCAPGFYGEINQKDRVWPLEGRFRYFRVPRLHCPFLLV